MVNAFLTQRPENSQSTEEFVKALVEGEGLKGIGGFSLVCGKVGEPLAVISNRTPSVEGITWIAKCKGETVGLSNAAIADRSWEKVTRGEELVRGVIKDEVATGSLEENLIRRLFHVLDDDTLPRDQKGGDWESQVKALRKSIFIPVIGSQNLQRESAKNLPAGISGAYGTQKQTIVLVSQQGKITYIERTLYDPEGRPTTGQQRDKRFEFPVER